MSLLSASARRHGQAGGVAAAADGQSRREPILMTIDVLDRLQAEPAPCHV